MCPYINGRALDMLLLVVVVLSVQSAAWLSTKTIATVDTKHFGAKGSVPWDMPVIDARRTRHQLQHHEA